MTYQAQLLIGGKLVEARDRVCMEEVFGPFVSVSTFKDAAEVLRIANGTPCGLGGVRASGYGREMGFEAMRDYTDAKSIWVNVDANIPPWYPR